MLAPPLRPDFQSYRPPPPPPGDIPVHHHSGEVWNFLGISIYSLPNTANFLVRVLVAYQ